MGILFRLFRHTLPLILLCCGAALQAGEIPMPRRHLSVGFYNIEVEVAATPEDRMRGLMQRKNLAENAGMLFVFPQAERHCMWMKNTLIPLSVAFLDDSGKILNIRDMQPHSEESHCADAPARYALEMNRGWFAKKGIAPGARIRLP